MSTAAATASSDYRVNLAALQSAQKPARGTPAYSRHVNRPAGRRVAAAAHVVGMTPNVATAISASLSGLALVLLVSLRPSWPVGIAVATLLAAGYVMDSVDGQLARLRGGGSISGEWLDHTVDCFKTSMLHLAVLVSFFRFPPLGEDSAAVLLVPVGFEVVAVVTYFGLITIPFLRKAHVGATPAADPAAGATPENPLRRWLILPTDYGFMCWTFVLLAWQPVFFAVYAAQFALGAGLLALALVKWWRELRAIDRTLLAA